MDFENILRTIQPFVIMFAALFGAFLTAIWVSVVIWTFRDIRSRSRDVFAQILATLMVLIFFPFFPLPGLILYMILRPRETLSEVYERSLEVEALLQGIEERMACPGCNRRIDEDYMICPTFHTRLKKACVSCGRLLHLRWNICPWCGAVQTAAKAIPSAPQPVALQPEPVVGVSMLTDPAASSLPEPADAVRRRVSAQVVPPDLVGFGIAGQVLGGSAGRPHPLWLFMQVFWKIANLPREAVVQRVTFGVGWMAQRPDVKSVSGFLQGNKFLRDKCFGQSRPAFDHNRQIGRGRVHPVARSGPVLGYS